jgi:osmotically-inducible protein OsmY
MNTLGKRKVKNKTKKKVRLKKDIVPHTTPNIVVVGNKKVLREMKKLSTNFNLNFIITDPTNLKDCITIKTIGIIIDEELVQYKIKSYLDHLLAHYKLLPIFLLARTKKRSSFYTGFYEKGLQAVINWPEDKKVFSDILIESLKPQPKLDGMSKADAKLADLIKVHLELQGNYKGLKIKVIEGFAFISGKVKSLIDLEVIEEEASNVLGVKKAIVKNITVKKAKKVSDKELERKLKMYTSHILGEEKRSISVKVKNSKITIIGSASNHQSIYDIEKFAKKQPGVTDVTRFVKYSPKTVKKNVKKAKLLEDKLKFLFDGVKFVSIKIYGNFAEVSGTVKIKEDKKLIEKYLMHVLPIKKVFNKLYIAS